MLESATSTGEEGWRGCSTEGDWKIIVVEGGDAASRVGSTSS